MAVTSVSSTSSSLLTPSMSDDGIEQVEASY